MGDRRTTRLEFNAIFSNTAILLLNGDSITVDGVIYEVTGQSEIESLGLLTFASCSRIVP